MTDQQEIVFTDIVAFAQCRMCLETLPPGVSPVDWARVAVGVTGNADLVVWCLRHATPLLFLPANEIAALLRMAAEDVGISRLKGLSWN